MLNGQAGGASGSNPIIWIGGPEKCRAAMEQWMDPTSRHISSELIALLRGR
jgi:hypothetical protein